MAQTRRQRVPPAVIPLVQVNGGSEELRRVQTNVEQATKKARSMPQTKGKKISVSMPASGNVTVAHELGRKPEGWHLGRATGSNNPSFRESSSDSRNITFTSSSACEVELWVF